MTLAAQIASDVSAVFLKTDDFAQEIKHYPGGDQALEEPVTAIVDLDTADMFIGGDSGGLAANERTNRSTLIGFLEVPVSVQVVVDEKHPSLWNIDGDIWTTVERTGLDNDMQTIKVSRVDQKSTRRAARK